MWRGLRVPAQHDPTSPAQAQIETLGLEQHEALTFAISLESNEMPAAEFGVLQNPRDQLIEEALECIGRDGERKLVNDLGLLRSVAAAGRYAEARCLSVLSFGGAPSDSRDSSDESSVDFSGRSPGGKSCGR